jgi:hypothetical protein
MLFKVLIFIYVLIIVQNYVTSFIQNMIYIIEFILFVRLMVNYVNCFVYLLL